jgi:Rho GTPase-activating protein 17
VNNNDYIDYEEVNHPETVASLITRYLHSLEEDLITQEFVIDYFKIQNYSKEKDKTQQIKEIINNLPKRNYNLIKTVFKLFYEVQLQKEKNLMDAKNIVLCTTIKTFCEINENVNDLKMDLIINYTNYFE